MLGRFASVGIVNIVGFQLKPGVEIVMGAHIMAGLPPLAPTDDLHGQVRTPPGAGNIVLHFEAGTEFIVLGTAGMEPGMQVTLP
jgi:hypothetical protein